MHLLFLIAGLWLLAAMSPGPNFVLIARTAARYRARASIVAIAGVAVATLVWALAGAFGIRSLFLAAPWTYAALKLAGGAYLIRVGLGMWRTATEHANHAVAAGAPAPSCRRLFGLGLATNLANPKTAVFISSLFATTMPSQPSIAWSVAAALLMSLVSAGWYTLVALALSRPRAIQLFERVRTAFDRVVGVVLAGFGAHLLISSTR